MRSNTELRPVVLALVALPTERNPAMLVGVRAVLMAHKVTAWEFMHMDEKPGIWGYDPEGTGEWHYKLRTFRNSTACTGYTFEGVSE